MNRGTTTRNLQVLVWFPNPSAFSSPKLNAEGSGNQTIQLLRAQINALTLQVRTLDVSQEIWHPRAIFPKKTSTPSGKMELQSPQDIWHPMAKILGYLALPCQKS